MWCMLHLGFVQQGKSSDCPLVLHAVHLTALGILLQRWLELLLLLLLLPPLWPRFQTLLLSSTAADEALSTPLQLAQKGEVMLGAAHSCERIVLLDRPHLCLVQLHEAFAAK